MSFSSPPREPPSQGYPLPAVDANGVALCEGMSVRILAIPDWLTHDLPEDEVSRLKVLEGTVMPILELDAFGMVWFGDNGPWFSLMPSEVAAISTPSHNAI